MVVFLDLEDESIEPDEDPRQGPFSSTRLYPANAQATGDNTNLEADNNSAITNAAGFSAALACYP
jgi:hypothetical protein